MAVAPTAALEVWLVHFYELVKLMGWGMVLHGPGDADPLWQVIRFSGTALASGVALLS
jgi:hypothetical protein